MKIEKCFCGNTPKWKSASRTLGHGHSPTFWWLECSCGMRTAESLWGSSSGDDIDKQNAINIWNKHQLSIKKRTVRLLTLATKWCPGNHRDFEEIKETAIEMGEV